MQHPEFPVLTERQDGNRFMVEGKRNGYNVLVATAYDAGRDDWAYHVYVSEDSKPLHRVTDKPTQHYGGTRDSALEQGLQLALHFLTPRNGGFQTSVRNDLSPR